MKMFHYSTLLLILPATINGHLGLNGPLHQKYAITCLKQLALTQFQYVSANNSLINGTNQVQLVSIITRKHLGTPAYEIQDGVIKALNELAQFNVQILANKLIQIGTEIEPKYYLFILESVGQFGDVFDFFTGLDNFNSNALAVVYVSGVSENYTGEALQILGRLWDTFFDDAYVLIPRGLDQFVLFALRFQFSPGVNCIRGVVLEPLAMCASGVFPDLGKYANGPFQDFGNCALNVISNKIEPYVITAQEGFEVKLLQTLGQKLNVLFNVTVTGFDTWGARRRNGSWSKGLGFVYGQNYIGVGNFYPAPEYVERFQFSTAYYYTKLIWVVPIADDVPNWRVLSVIFTWYLWALLIGLMGVFSAVLKIVSVYIGETHSYQYLSYDVLVTVQIILWVAVNHHPRKDLSRVLFVALTIFSIILACVYNSALINYLTQTQREHQVSKTSEILANEYVIGGLSEYKKFFNVSTSRKSMQVFDLYQVNEEDTFHSWLTKVADDRDTATIGSDIFFKYLIFKKSQHMLDEAGNPKIYLFRAPILKFPVAIVVKEGFPFLRAFNRVIQRAFQGGLIREIIKMYTIETKQLDALFKSRNEAQKLKIEHLQGAFAVLGLGFAGGILSFVGELVVGGWDLRKKAKFGYFD